MTTPGSKAPSDIPLRRIADLLIFAAVSGHGGMHSHFGIFLLQPTWGSAVGAILQGVALCRSDGL